MSKIKLITFLQHKPALAATFSQAPMQEILRVPFLKYFLIFPLQLTYNIINNISFRCTTQCIVVSPDFLSQRLSKACIFYFLKISHPSFPSPSGDHMSLLSRTILIYACYLSITMNFFSPKCPGWTSDISHSHCHNLLQTLTDSHLGGSCSWQQWREVSAQMIFTFIHTLLQNFNGVLILYQTQW